jgi:hypothetical protein
MVSRNHTKVTREVEPLKAPNFWPLRHADPILNRRHCGPDLLDATVAAIAAMDAVQTLGYIAVRF